MRLISPVFVAASCAALGCGASVPGSVTTPQSVLEMLDPTRRAASVCGARGDGLAERLRLAAEYGAVHGGETGPMPLLSGLPPVALTISSGDPVAQRYFAQGMMLVYGFNHVAAIRSFQEAQARDSDCAMCFWGEALAYGPNINAPMDPATRDAMFAALARAEELAPGATVQEQALIAALAKRYSQAPDADRGALDAAYAEAMLAVAARWPEQEDIAVLAAEAVMGTSPWNYWEADGRTLFPAMLPAKQLLETVVARTPDHPQASHLLIHLMEASRDAKLAEPAADRLASGIAPGAGHLVHMPAHIYFRLGRFADSIRVNVDAVRADEAFLDQVGDDGLYRYGYYPHNVHFLVTSAQMAGDLDTALRESARLMDILKPDPAIEIGWMQMIHAAPYLAHAQFSDADTILALPAPDARMPMVGGLRHYARAVAYAERQDGEGFAASLAALRAAGDAPNIAALEAQYFPAGDVLRLAETVAQGRWAMAAGDWDGAIAQFTAAAEIEDGLPYLEPPIWSYPVRQALGAALYQAGRYGEAKTAFLTALSAYPANGWVLWGLGKTEQALGNRLEAEATEAAFGRAWLGDPAWLTMARL
ncbi:tetratricopeptide repeat protein [Stakelama tenebrarum]|uniref:Uncharacterized protein n=1 Tax=Stakelama tenebrarum TaxID=2711215 RepID=A0A6G6Y402_9SPHN|nr:hypothetical protein [Sphingosinithalassobacter tenebrarum]QIG79296.1 hypothetical protein G5C33_05485 [Sphingosinithalassobacter tenebrarum]